MHYNFEDNLQPIFRSPSDDHYYFGYYDKSQLDAGNSKLLALRVGFMDRIPDEGDTAEIGYFDISEPNSSFIPITDTRTFNWQQGCMLQWLGPNFNRFIIYNDLKDNKFISVIFDLETGSKRILPMPIYSVSRNGKYAICIDHERHHFCRRGYSYGGVKNLSKDKEIVPGDGIWRICLETGETQQIVSLNALLENKPLSNMEGAVHYVEHLMFNPSSKRFCFLHRWKLREGGIFSRFYTCDDYGDNLYLLCNSGRMSHFCWMDDHRILAYGGLPNKLNSLRRSRSLVKYLFKPLLPLYHGLVRDDTSLSKKLTGDSYLLFTDQSEIVERVASDISYEDGHPSSVGDSGNIFVSDTYPNSFNGGSVASLIIFNLEKEESRLLARLGSIPSYDDTPLRCDLHPKISFDGNYVCVDTMDNGVRGIYVYSLSYLTETDKNDVGT